MRIAPIATINREQLPQWLRGEGPKRMVDKACIGESGALLCRSMTAEERLRYGEPAIVRCTVCGRELPRTRGYFYISQGSFQDICKDCVRERKLGGD